MPLQKCKYHLYLVAFVSPKEFEYHAPAELQEAFSLLKEHGDNAKILAGGQSLIPLLKSRIFSVPHLVDIGRIRGLKNVVENGSEIRIGALVTISDLEANNEIRTRFQAISDAAGLIGDPLVRNRGTIGGNISHGDPSNDMPAAMVALKARFKLSSQQGERIVDAGEFFIDTLQTDVREGEILTEIIVPEPRNRSGSAYMKLKKTAGDFCVAGVAVSVSLDQHGGLSGLNVAITAAGPRVIEVKGLEEKVTGKKLNEELSAIISTEAVNASEPAEDFYGTVEYKRKVIGLLTGDCLELAVERAKEGAKR